LQVACHARCVHALWRSRTARAVAYCDLVSKIGGFWQLTHGFSNSTRSQPWIADLKSNSVMRLATATVETSSDYC
jgi:hypothetical protein